MRLRLCVPLMVACLLAALVVAHLPGESDTALAASKKVTDAVTVIKSDVGWGQRLHAFEVLRIDGSSEAISELVKLLGHKDPRVSSTACTALARMKSEDAKGKLKDVIEDMSEDSGVRQAAMNALARHGSSSDRSWIDTQAKNDAALASQLAALKSMALWK